MESPPGAVIEVSTECKGVARRDESRDLDDPFSTCSASFEGSVAASPSIESFSTLQDQDDVADLQYDGRELQIRVDNPQKLLSTLETYITFRVTTKTSRSDFEETEYVVRRRFNDFLWLREKLVQNHPNNLIPPLPEKHTLMGQLDRYSKEFILHRMAMLHKFMNRLADHPFLSFDANFKGFITAKPSDFTVLRKSKQGLISRWTDSIQNISGIYLAKGRPHDFDLMLNYSQSLTDKLTSIEKISHRINKEQQDHLGELQQLHPVFNLWSSVEPELGNLLATIGQAFESISTEEQTLVNEFPHITSQPLKEFLLYIDAVKESLERRDASQIEYELVLEELGKKRAEKEQLQSELGQNQETNSQSYAFWKSPENKEERLQKLSASIGDLIKLAEEKQDQTECANETLRSDFERWHLEKRRDLKQLFLSMADAQIKFHEKSLAAWEQVLQDVNKEGRQQTN